MNWSMCNWVYTPWLFGLSSLASLSWALGRGGLLPWPCSGVPPCTPCPWSPRQRPGLGQGQQLLQGERWALLEVKVLFQKGKWFRQRSSWFNRAEGDRQCPGVSLYRGHLPGCSWSDEVTPRWHQAQAVPTAPRVFPSNAGCYLTSPW